MIQVGKDLAEEVGVFEACKTLGIPRSTFYYVQKPRKPSPRKDHTRKLSEEEEIEVRKSSAVNASRIKHPGTFMPLYWMKETISAAGEPCIAS